MKVKEATYVGGSLDGKLVRPSIVQTCTHGSLPMPVVHTYEIPGADYPMAMNEYYEPEENEDRVVFKLVKTETVELL